MQEYIEYIAGSGEFLATIAHEMLYLNPLERVVESFRLDWVSAEWLLDGLRKLNRLALHTHKIELLYDHNIPRYDMLVDRAHMRNCLQMIVDNAIRYSMDSQSVRLEVMQDEKNTLLIEVHDEGIGIPENELSRIWEPYFRGDIARQKNDKGTGIGLTVAKQIVEAHQGEIRVASKLGVGTKISIALPQNNWRYRRLQ